MFSLHIGIALALSLVIGIAAGYYDLRVRELEKSHREVEVVEISALIGQHLKLYDFSAIVSIGQLILQREHIFGVAVRDFNGYTIFEQLPDTKFDKSMYTLDTRLLKGAETNPDINNYGWIELYLASDSPAKSIWRAIYTMFLVTLFCLAISSITIAVYVTWFLARPLRELRVAIDKTLETGEPTRTQFLGRSHLGLFAEQFNKMQTKLVQVQSGLANSLENLENQTRLSTEQADSLEQILVAGKQSVLYFRQQEVPVYYNDTKEGLRLFDGLPKLPTRSATEFKSAVLSMSHEKIQHADIIINQNSAPKDGHILYELEVTGKNGQIRSIKAISILSDNLAILVSDVTDVHLLENRVRHTEKLDALGALAGGVVHDMNNILAIIEGNLHLIELSSVLKGKPQEYLANALSTCGRAEDVVKGLLSYTRSSDVSFEVISASESARSLGLLFDSVIGANYSLEFDVQDNLNVYARKSEMETMLLNLVVNARDAMPSGGRILVRCVESSSIMNNLNPNIIEGFVVIEVVDEGTGLRDDIIEKITEPFFTTKSIGEGTGMGLAMVADFANRNGGQLDYYNRENGGAVFRVALPRVEKQIAHQGQTENSSGEKQAIDGATNAHILIVDDEIMICNLLKETLAWMITDITTAYSVEEAKSHIQKNEKFDLVITDMVLPDGSGIDILLYCQEIGLEVPVIQISGNLEFINQTDREGGFAGSFTKPINIRQLQKMVARHLLKDSNNTFSR